MTKIDSNAEHVEKTEIGDTGNYLIHDTHNGKYYYWLKGKSQDDGVGPYDTREAALQAYGQVFETDDSTEGDDGGEE
jgi:hypothetical protein